MILADYKADFHALSLRHEALLKRGEDLLDTHQRGEAQHPTYVVIGTFGAGKKQFLHHLDRQAMERRLVSLIGTSRTQEPRYTAVPTLRASGERSWLLSS